MPVVRLVVVSVVPLNARFPASVITTGVLVAVETFAHNEDGAIVEN